MKRTVLLLTLMTLILSLFLGCTATNAAVTANRIPADSAQAGPSNISPEQAAQIALEHVGLTAEQVIHLQVDYDIDDGIGQYDVEFYHESFEYEFEIHGQTGKILSFDKDYASNSTKIS